MKTTPPLTSLSSSETAESLIVTPDCCHSNDVSLARFSANRRSFIKSTVATSASLIPWLPIGAAASGESAAKGSTGSDPLAKQLWKSLSEEQKKSLAFRWDDPLRLKVDNSWMITKKSVADLLKPDQQDCVKQIFKGLHSDEYADRVLQQVEYDSEGKGFAGGTSIAFFGEPEAQDFQFVLSGRHVTRRCDANRHDGIAFGGPIFYGHSVEESEEADHKGNAFWFQAQRMNELFEALSGPQRETCLLSGPSRGERGAKTVELTGRKTGLPGLRAADLSADQLGLVISVLSSLLAPFRPADAAETLAVIEKGGLENLHLACYKDENIGNDRLWDVWQIEGPQMVWYFRGKPHVHVWAHVKSPA